MRGHLCQINTWYESLRWHYPNQVKGRNGITFPLSRFSPAPPVTILNCCLVILCIYMYEIARGILKNGNWWMSCLGTHPAHVGFSMITNIGRETLLYSEIWDGDWPEIN